MYRTAVIIGKISPFRTNQVRPVRTYFRPGWMDGWMDGWMELWRVLLYSGAPVHMNN